MGHRSVESLSPDHGMTTGGLYIIWLSDTHYYGGRAVDFRQRWARHLRELRRGTHKNPHMQAVYNLYGRFEPCVLSVIQTKDEAQPAEQMWLDQNFGLPGCLNLSRSSRNNNGPWSEATRRKLLGVNRGRKMSEATRRAMSEAQRNRDWVISEDGRRRLSEASSNHRHSETTRQKMSTFHKENPKSPELREKLRVTAIETNRRRKGEVRSDEVRRRISDVVKGLVWVHNNAGSCRRIPPSELPEYLTQGWVRGRGLRS